jgi:hypothetical protein
MARYSMPTRCSEGRVNNTPAIVSALALTALLCACASAPSTPQQRQAYLAELSQAYDVEGIVSHAQSEALGDARRNIERMNAQYAGSLTQVSPAQRNKLDAALDRFVSASRTMPDLNTATAVWAQGFAGNLTDEDLKQVIEFSRTPAGRAQIAAARDGNAALRTYLAQQRSANVDRAEAQYLATLQAIAGGR